MPQHARTQDILCNVTLTRSKFMLSPHTTAFLSQERHTHSLNPVLFQEPYLGELLEPVTEYAPRLLETTVPKIKAPGGGHYGERSGRTLP